MAAKQSYGYCPDCRARKPERLVKLELHTARIQDGCYVRPLYCPRCCEEKGMYSVVILEAHDDDLYASAGGVV